MYDTVEDDMTGEIKRILRLMQHPQSYGTGPESVTVGFLEAMDNFAQKTVGEKGGEAFTEYGLGDMRLALFQMLRDTPRDKLREYVRNCMAQVEKLRNNGQLDEAIQIELDLFRLTFQSRDKDNGKGERDITYYLIIELHKWKPESIRKLIPMLPEKYGSWFDYLPLITLFEKEANDVSKDESLEISNTVRSMMSHMVSTLKSDAYSENPTLAGKWAPRENSKYSVLARRIAIMMFADDEYNTAKRMYKEDPNKGNQDILSSHKRRLYRLYRAVKLNEKLKTVEVLQCAKNWKDIEISRIPARHLKIRTKALQNRKVRIKMGESLLRTDDPDRIECANNMEEHFAKVNKGEVAIKSSGLFIYELVKNYWNGAPWDETWELQFKEIVNKAPALESWTVLADTSGSMHGDPILVAVSMAALIAKKSKYYPNRYISFNTTPKWKMINPDADLYTIVNQMKNDNDWGGHTDFAQAVDLMVAVCKDYKVPKEEVRDMKMVVVSDMMFDQALGGYYGNSVDWTSSARRIKNAWMSAGYPEDYHPEIIYWNVRNTDKFIATGSTPGVQMMAGYNQEQLKILLKAGTITDGEVTPMDTLRAALDGECYDDIAKTLCTVGEGIFSHLRIVKIDESEKVKVSDDKDIQELNDRVDKIQKMKT